MPPAVVSVGRESSSGFANRGNLARRHAGEPPLPAMRRRIVNYVEANLDDPELSIDAIALAIGCSRRYLHKAFGSAPETLGEMIWRSRLERCAGQLRGAEMADRSITEIAFAAGFNSSPHFSRLFRARYGTTPREWRKRGDPGEGRRF
jgi:AraC-like DNA-binding protein